MTWAQRPCWIRLTGIPRALRADSLKRARLLLTHRYPYIEKIPKKNHFKVMQSNKFLLAFMLKFMKVLVLTWMLILMFLLRLVELLRLDFFQEDDFLKALVA